MPVPLWTMAGKEDVVPPSCNAVKSVVALLYIVQYPSVVDLMYDLLVTPKYPLLDSMDAEVIVLLPAYKSPLLPILNLSEPLS